MRKFLLILTLLPPAMVLAQAPPSGGPYRLPKHVIASGGATASASGWSLTGTVGQSAVQVVTGGAYELFGGFHGPAIASESSDLIFRDGFEN